MYPRVYTVTLIIPWQPPQRVTVRELTRGIYRLALVDRYERTINYVGTDIGFGVALFKSTYDQSYLVVKGMFDEVIYKPAKGDPMSITVLDIESDDC